MSISRCIFSILLLMQILWSCNVLEAPVLPNDEVEKVLDFTPMIHLRGWLRNFNRKYAREIWGIGINR